MLPSCLSLFLNLPAHKRTVTCKCPDAVLLSLLLATAVCRLLGGQTKTASAICSPTNICYSKFNIVVNHIFDLYFCCMHLLVNKLFVFVFVFVFSFSYVFILHLWFSCRWSPGMSPQPNNDTVDRAGCSPNSFRVVANIYIMVWYRLSYRMFVIISWI